MAVFMNKFYKYRYFIILVISEIIILGKVDNENLFSILYGFPQRMIFLSFAILFTILQQLYLMDTLYDYLKMRYLIKLRLGKTSVKYIFYQKFYFLIILFLNNIIFTFIFINHLITWFINIVYILIITLIFSRMIEKKENINKFLIFNILSMMIIRFFIQFIYNKVFI